MLKIRRFEDQLIGSFLLTNSSFCFCCFNAYEWSFFSICSIWKAKQHRLITVECHFHICYCFVHMLVFPTLCVSQQGIHFINCYHKTWVKCDSKNVWTVNTVTQYRICIYCWLNLFFFVFSTMLLLLYSIFHKYLFNITLWCKDFKY